MALLYSAAKSSPTTSPTKHDVTRQKEIQEYADRVFVRVYKTSDVEKEDEDE